jgi:hypothetical protein
MNFIFRSLTTISCLICLFMMTGPFSAQGFPTDHQGEDLLITEDTKLSGEHLNINRFHVATSTTLSVSLAHPGSKVVPPCGAHSSTENRLALWRLFRFQHHSKAEI